MSLARRIAAHFVAPADQRTQLAHPPMTERRPRDVERGRPAAEPTAPAPGPPTLERSRRAVERGRPAAEPTPPAPGPPTLERSRRAVERGWPAAEPTAPAPGPPTLERGWPAAERGQPAAARILPAAESPPVERGGRPDERIPPAAGTQRPPPAVAVLAPPTDAPALGAALGLALARARRAPVSVVCVWAPNPIRSAWRAPAMPTASRVAAALRARGHDASAAGRLVVVRLSETCDEAADQAMRVAAAAGSAPTVLALAGPRAAAFDDLLAMQDLVVVAVAPAADAALARLATAGLQRALTCPVPPADPGRALAAAGLALLPSTRRALAAPVAAVA